MCQVRRQLIDFDRMQFYSPVCMCSMNANVDVTWCGVRLVDKRSKNSIPVNPWTYPSFISSMLLNYRSFVIYGCCATLLGMCTYFLVFIVLSATADVINKTVQCNVVVAVNIIDCASCFISYSLVSLWANERKHEKSCSISWFVIPTDYVKSGIQSPRTYC